MDFFLMGAIGKSTRGMGQLGQRPLLHSLLEYLCLQPLVTARSQQPPVQPLGICFPEWPDLPQRRMVAMEPPAPHSCPEGICPVGEASLPAPSSASWLKHVLMCQENLVMVALSPPLRRSDSSWAALAALQTCLQGCRFLG